MDEETKTMETELTENESENDDENESDDEVTLTDNEDENEGDDDEGDDDEGDDDENEDDNDEVTITMNDNENDNDNLEIELDVDNNDVALFDPNVSNLFTKEHHPELQEINHNEMLALTKQKHKTIPFMTKYEYTRIVGLRASQLDYGADPLIQIDPNIIDSSVIAEMELKKKVLPFIICRPIPGGTREFWNIQDLEILH